MPRETQPRILIVAKADLVDIQAEFFRIQMHCILSAVHQRRFFASAFPATSTHLVVVGPDRQDRRRRRSRVRPATTVVDAHHLGHSRSQLAKIDGIFTPFFPPANQKKGSKMIAATRTGSCRPYAVRCFSTSALAAAAAKGKKSTGVGASDQALQALVTTYHSAHHFYPTPTAQDAASQAKYEEQLDTWVRDAILSPDAFQSTSASRTFQTLDDVQRSRIGASQTSMFDTLRARTSAAMEFKDMAYEAHPTRSGHAGLHDERAARIRDTLFGTISTDEGVMKGVDMLREQAQRPQQQEKRHQNTLQGSRSASS